MRVVNFRIDNRNQLAFFRFNKFSKLTHISNKNFVLYFLGIFIFVITILVFKLFFLSITQFYGKIFKLFFLIYRLFLSIFSVCVNTCYALQSKIPFKLFILLQNNFIVSIKVDHHRYINSSLIYNPYKRTHTGTQTTVRRNHIEIVR